jgi:hypothetical protein
LQKASIPSSALRQYCALQGLNAMFKDFGVMEMDATLKLLHLEASTNRFLSLFFCLTPFELGVFPIFSGCFMSLFRNGLYSGFSG